ncbi:MAG: hypothetical protein U9R21_03810 [Candidatus Thermoplasmatota archaeon]|nr:hypothetical protein [Candidatus Thermoplasmatota archaeon]
MGGQSQEKIKAVLCDLEEIKIFKIGDLTSKLSCSVPNARLKLKSWKTYTSYNQNGRFYTLPQVPEFNQHGLWRYKDIAFSKHGNLKKTIIHLVTVSPAGLSGRELGELLGLSPQSFMHHFSKCPGMRREKYEGVFVYFTDDDELYKRQKRQKFSDVSLSTVATISDSEAVMILVAIINHHDISANVIMSLPEIQKSKLTLPAIQGFMEHHGLIKKNPIFKP